MKAIKANLPVVVGIAIPVLMILIITGVIYAQNSFSSTPAPSQNFVYGIGDSLIASAGYRGGVAYPQNACAKDYYKVASGTLVKFPSNAQLNKDISYCKDYPNESVEPMFFLHDVKTNTSTRLTFEQISKMKIDDTPKSKDGYEYVQYVPQEDLGMFFFGSANRDPSVRYLKNDRRYERMNLQIPSSSYYGQDVFLGWVVE